MKIPRRLIACVVMTAVLLVAAPAAASQGVSPGALDRLAQVNNACPTFSWGMDGDASAYELVVYVLPEDASQPVELTADGRALICAKCRLSYRIEDDIPIMLIDEAAPLEE